MNRAILHNCPSHTHDDLILTATEMVAASTEDKTLRDILSRKLKIIANLYTTVLRRQKVADFFGARDFYACVQLLTARIKSNFF